MSCGDQRLKYVDFTFSDYWMRASRFMNFLFYLSMAVSAISTFYYQYLNSNVGFWDGSKTAYDQAISHVYPIYIWVSFGFFLAFLSTSYFKDKIDTRARFILIASYWLALICAVLYDHYLWKILEHGQGG